MALSLAKDFWKKVLVIDGDTQGNTSLSFFGDSWHKLSQEVNREEEKRNASALFNLNSTYTIPELANEVSGLPNLHVILADQKNIFRLEVEIDSMNQLIQERLSKINQRLKYTTDTKEIQTITEEIDEVIKENAVTRRSWERRLQRRLLTAKNMYDYILIDLPPTLDKIPINAWIASDFLLVPISDLFSVHWTWGLIGHIAEIYRDYNEDLRFMFFFNKIETYKNQHTDGEMPTQNSEKNIRDFIEVFSQNEFLQQNSKIIQSVIPDSAEIKKSIRVFGNMDIPNASTFKKFTEEIIQYTQSNP